MIQAAPKPSAKKIPRTASKGSQAQVRYTSAKNKMPESQASTGSAQNRGDHSRPAGVRGVEASQHREGQEEPSQQSEYDGSDIRVVAGQVPNRRTNANTLPTRISTPSPGAQERMREAHTQRIARRQALRQEEAAGASTATPVIDNRSNFQHPQHGVIQSLLSINNNNTAGVASSWADTADDDVPVIDRDHQYSETPVNSPMDVDDADAPMVRDSMHGVAPLEAVNHNTVHLDPRAVASDDRAGADDDDEWLHIPVAVVAAGWKDENFDQVRNLLRNGRQDWKGWDLVPYLKRDPWRDGGIGHRQSGRNENTQRQVFKQQGFPGLIEWIVSWILDACVWPQENVDNRMDSGGLGLVLWCNHGWHRSDTVMRKVQEVLNSLHWPNGARIFTCQIFPLNERLGREAQQAMLDEAATWVHSPWEMTESTFSMPKSIRYACWACQNDYRAMVNFNHCWEWEQGPLRQLVLSFLGNRFPPESRETERLRRAPPSDHRQSQANGIPDVEGTFRNHRVYHETNSPIIWLGEVMYAPVNQSMTGRRGHQVPQWASISFDAECWHCILTDLTIDDAAIDFFFRLAQAHEQAAWQCSELLTKLVRKHACHEFGQPWESPKRASKWFHKACCQARLVLTACLEGEWWATPYGVRPVPGAQAAFESYREFRQYYR